jgi:hypothetical protein
VDPPVATSGDAAQLLDFEMDQLAPQAHLHVPDRLAGGPIEMVKPVKPVANQYPDARCLQSDDAGDAGRPQAALRAQADDPSLLGRFCPGRRGMRTAGAILQAGHPLGLVATPTQIYLELTDR